MNSKPYFPDDFLKSLLHINRKFEHPIQDLSWSIVDSITNPIHMFDLIYMITITSPVEGKSCVTKILLRLIIPYKCAYVNIATYINHKYKATTKSNIQTYTKIYRVQAPLPSPPTFNIFKCSKTYLCDICFLNFKKDNDAVFKHEINSIIHQNNSGYHRICTRKLCEKELTKRQLATTDIRNILFRHNFMDEKSTLYLDKDDNNNKQIVYIWEAIGCFNYHEEPCVRVYYDDPTGHGCNQKFVTLDTLYKCNPNLCKLKWSSYIEYNTEFAKSKLNKLNRYAGSVTGSGGGSVTPLAKGSLVGLLV
jgi:virulence-associated protein VapD